MNSDDDENVKSFEELREQAVAKFASGVAHWPLVDLQLVEAFKGGINFAKQYFEPKIKEGRDEVRMLQNYIKAQEAKLAERDAEIKKQVELRKQANAHCDEWYKNSKQDLDKLTALTAASEALVKHLTTDVGIQQKAALEFVLNVVRGNDWATRKEEP